MKYGDELVESIRLFPLVFFERVTRISRQPRKLAEQHQSVLFVFPSIFWRDLKSTAFQNSGSEGMMLSKRGTSTRPPVEMFAAMVSVVVVVDVRALSRSPPLPMSKKLGESLSVLSPKK
jgi:hypothetical protein